MYQPFFWGDYLRDTGQLTLIQHGAYLRLIGEYWCTGKPLPHQTGKLWRAVGAFDQDEQQAIADVLSLYFEETDSGWVHHRIERDLTNHAAQAEKAAERAQKAAAARWDKTDEMPQAMLQACSKHSSEQCLLNANHSTPLQTISIPETHQLPAARVRDRAPEVTMAFDNIFAQYPPNRRDRRKAFPVFSEGKLWKVGDSIVECIMRLKKSPEWQKDAGRWIPSLETFLERRPWEAVSTGSQPATADDFLAKLFPNKS